MPIPQHLIDNARTRFDLTEAAHQDSLFALTEALLALDDAALAALPTAVRAPDAPLEPKIAAKLVDSRRFMHTMTSTD